MDTIPIHVILSVNLIQSHIWEFTNLFHSADNVKCNAEFIGFPNNTQRELWKLIRIFSYARSKDRIYFNVSPVTAMFLFDLILLSVMFQFSMSPCSVSNSKYLSVHVCVCVYVASWNQRRRHLNSYL